MKVNNMDIKNNFSSIEQITGQYLSNQQKRPINKTAESISFEEVLNLKRTELKFSKHANERLTSRNIDLSKEQIQRLEQGTNKAREKGIQESLVMVDNLYLPILGFIYLLINNV